MKALIAAIMIIAGSSAYADVPSEFAFRTAGASLISVTIYEHLKEKGYSKEQAKVHAFGLTVMAAVGESIVSGYRNDKIASGAFGAALPVILLDFK